MKKELINIGKKSQKAFNFQVNLKKEQSFERLLQFN